MDTSCYLISGITRYDDLALCIEEQPDLVFTRVALPFTSLPPRHQPHHQHHHHINPIISITTTPSLASPCTLPQPASTSLPSKLTHGHRTYTQVLYKQAQKKWDDFPKKIVIRSAPMPADPDSRTMPDQEVLWCQIVTLLLILV